MCDVLFVGEKVLQPDVVVAVVISFNFMGGKNGANTFWTRSLFPVYRRFFIFAYQLNSSLYICVPLHRVS